MSPAKAARIIPILFLALSACATHPIVPPQDQLAVAKGETGLEIAYNTAASLYLQKVADGSLSPADHATAKRVLQQWLAALHALRTAESLGNAQDMATQLADVTRLAGQAAAILHAGAQP